ncbi:DUF3099 domain-containing protein [Frigoribacterium faeni]|uniref:DUF3099 domain-containing protein n=1 Tax=Frigoribacterium faeni TaxID=145483 RepID=A0A7W3JHJ8_9MICO|nr:DUF3099 domain-containing protein [Frigoribacterium faeni]MBA8812913.1 hypothetical protein [Frigoribacterium faeni]
MSELKTSQPITSLPPSPADDRHARMVRYLVAMGIRIVCIALCFIIPLGWWTLLPVAGAVLIPYFAVVLVNVGHDPGQDVERPGTIEAYRTPDQPWSPPTATPSWHEPSSDDGSARRDRGSAA